MFRAILSAALLTTVGSAIAQEPWASKAQPGDVAKSHVETIATGGHKYIVVHGGTMDGANCRSPMGCGMNREGAIIQTWQSNRAVRMENVGHTDVVDPWLSDGRNNFRNIKEIVAAAVTLGMSDEEKARALWYQQIQHRYHSSAGGEDLGDPVRSFKTSVWRHSTSTKRVGSAARKYSIEDLRSFRKAGRPTCLPLDCVQDPQGAE